MRMYGGKTPKKLSRRPGLAQLSVNNVGHGRSITSDNTVVAAKNDEKQQVKTATMRLYTFMA